MEPNHGIEQIAFESRWGRQTSEVPDAVARDAILPPLRAVILAEALRVA
jgi:hypothetical protein